MACTTSGLFALALLLTLGCSSSNDDGEDAPGKCSAMVSDFCNTVADCAVEESAIESSERSSYVSQCVETGDTAIGCSDAVGVSSNYDSCVDAIHDLECAGFAASGIVLPLQCNEVIEVAE